MFCIIKAQSELLSNTISLTQRLQKAYLMKRSQQKITLVLWFGTIEDHFSPGFCNFNSFQWTILVLLKWQNPIVLIMYMRPRSLDLWGRKQNVDTKNLFPHCKFVCSLPCAHRPLCSNLQTVAGSNKTTMRPKERQMPHIYLHILLPLSGQDTSSSK